MYICPSGSCLLGTALLYGLSSSFASVFSHFSHFQRFVQCGAVYTVQVATMCAAAQGRGWTGARACREAHSGRSGALWARSGAGVVQDTGSGSKARTAAHRGCCGGLGACRRAAGARSAAGAHSATGAHSVRGWTVKQGDLSSCAYRSYNSVVLMYSPWRDFHTLMKTLCE